MNLDPIRDGFSPCCSRIGGGAKISPSVKPNLSHISHKDETWHSCTLPKEDIENI